MSIVQNIKKTINYSRKNGYKEAVLAAWERMTARYYADYTYQSLTEQELDRQREDKTLDTICFSLIVPAFETHRNHLTDLIESCLAQTYGNWELILADGSKSEEVSAVMAQYEDPRIHYIRLQENGGISENTNQALAYATGDYCGLVDHDDMLTPDALYEMASAITRAKAEGRVKPVLLYSDEDKCNAEGNRFYDPHIKQDFNLDLILTNNYICHLCVVETQTIQKLLIRKQYDGAQDYDLVLRIVSSLLLRERENAASGKVEDYICHVPKVLYHWRCHEGSTADNPQSKMYAYEAGRKALADFTSRMGWKADIRHNKHLGFYRIAYRNDVLLHREDLAAVGGFIVHAGKIASGCYKGQPRVYAGYMNRMDLYQNVTLLDIRNLEVNKAYIEVYKKVTGHPYESTFAVSQAVPLPQWIRELTPEQLDKLNRKLSHRLLAGGARLLLDPEAVRKL